MIWNLSPCGTTDAQTALPVSLHITEPSQCPRIDKPPTASISRTRPAVAGRARKVVAQVVWDCPLVTNRYNWQFSQDTLKLSLNRYYAQNRIFVVKLVNNP